MKRLIGLTIILGMVAILAIPVLAQEDDSSRKILREGILGAATGAIASSASGGKAGKGALIGAGTNVIGGALLDTVMGPSQPKQQVIQQPQTVYVPAQPVYQQAPSYVQPVETSREYKMGYQDGYRAGYQDGMDAHRRR